MYCVTFRLAKEPVTEESIKRIPVTEFTFQGVLIYPLNVGRRMIYDNTHHNGFAFVIHAWLDKYPSYITINKHGKI